MARYSFKNIYIEGSANGGRYLQDILSNIKDPNITYVNKREELEKQRINRDAGRISAWKENLLFSKKEGNFIRRCPCTHGGLSCSYHVINLYNNCVLECSYCILQRYINTPFVEIYVNLDDLFSEINHFISQDSKAIYRFGTGELSDSLALDHITNYSKELIKFFAEKENAVLELKTKSANIENLIGLAHNRRTVVSWSISPQKISTSEEPNTDSIYKRLSAAMRCQDAGYLIGLHLDPVILYKGCEDDYKKLIADVYQKLNPENIVWISLGGLRFNKDLAPIIRERFPDSKIMTEEMFPGADGKIKYLKGVRRAIFSDIISWIRSYDESAFIYLCMEGEEMWKRTIGWAPEDEAELDRRFQERVKSLWDSH